MAERRGRTRPGDAAPEGHPWAYAHHLSRLAEARGFRSWREVARATGLPQSSVSKIVTHRVPWEATLGRILAGIGATREDLYRALDAGPPARTDGAGTIGPRPVGIPRKD